MNKLIIKKLAVVAVTLLSAVPVTRAFAQTSQVEQRPSVHGAHCSQASLAGSDAVVHCDSMLQHVKLEMPRADTGIQASLAQDNAPIVGKTRAQVMAELVQAEEAGLVPTSRHSYPDIDASVVKSNRYRFASAERWWKRNTNADTQ